VWRLIWRLTTIGVPLKFQSDVDTEELLKRIRKKSVWQALRSQEESNKVAFRLHRNHLVAYVVRVSFWVLVRPVFYADVNSVGAATEISGRFLFQKLVRAEIWLVTLFALIYEGIWVLRCLNGVRDGLPWDLLIGYFAMLLPSFVLIGAIFLVLTRFTRRNIQDINLLTDELKAIATQ